MSVPSEASGHGGNMSNSHARIGDNVQSSMVNQQGSLPQSPARGRGMERRACNRCHDQKLRCTRDGPGRGLPCRRCQRLMVNCTYAYYTPKLSDGSRRSLSSRVIERQKHKSQSKFASKTLPTTECTTETLLLRDSPARTSNPEHGIQLRTVETTFETSPLVYSQTGQRQKCPIANDLEIVRPDLSSYLSALDNCNVQYLQLSGDDDDLEHAHGDPQSNRWSKFSVSSDRYQSPQLQSYFDAKQPELLWGPASTAMIGHSIDDSRGMRELFQLNISLDQVANIINGNSSIAIKARSLMPLSQSLTSTLRLISTKRRLNNSTTPEDIFSQNTYSYPNQKPNTQSQPWTDGAIDLIILSCYIRLLQIFTKFVEFLGQRHEQSRFDRHRYSILHTPQLMPGLMATELTPISGHEVNTVLHTQLVLHLLERVSQCTKTTLASFIETPGSARDNEALVGSSSFFSLLEYPQLHSFPLGQRDNRDFLTEPLRLILSELVDKENNLRRTIACLQSSCF